MSKGGKFAVRYAPRGKAPVTRRVFAGSKMKATEKAARKFGFKIGTQWLSTRPASTRTMVRAKLKKRGRR